MLFGAVTRSPHAHARILGIDTSKAEAAPGVKAVITSADFPVISAADATKGTAPANFQHLSDNLMAREKVLYDGHTVAAVAATSVAAARRAAAMIEVQYEVLPHVLDVDDAMADGAPVLHEDMRTAGVDPKPETASNVAKRVQFTVGDCAAGFEAAEVVLERDYKTQPVHQGYIEPHAAVADATETGQTTIWSSSQGHFMVRQFCAGLLEMNVADIRVTPAEIGGGFGAKTTVWLEPYAVLLSRKAQRPVKMTMNRDEVFRGTGPTSGSSMRVRIGATRDGRITAAEGEFRFQAGAYPGSPVHLACMCAFTPYNIENVDLVGYDVVTNRPKAAAYRAPGAPIGAFAVESALDELATELGLAPLELRSRNAAKQGTRTPYGPTLGVVGYEETVAAARAHPHLQAPLGPNQGRGIASGSGSTLAAKPAVPCRYRRRHRHGELRHPGYWRLPRISLHDGRGLEIDVGQVRAAIPDTSSLGFNRHTGGSRVTFAAGMMVVDSTNDVVQQLRERAALLWDIDVEAVEWRDGAAHPAGENAGTFEPLTLKDIAAKTPDTGGPINARKSANVQAPGAAFATHIVDVEVDAQTGAVKILRYTAIQDAGRAIHPSYVEGQMQGGVAQGIGWALNEEYIYDVNGRLENPSFLDYRMPVASDLPMIDTVIIEVPNPTHPFGVRGVGEVPIVPPMAAIANAIENAIGIRLNELPMSPPRVLAALDAQRSAA